MRAIPRLASTLVLAHALIATAAAQKHPHFNDGGTLAWYTTFAAAKEAAQKADRMILVEYGRQA